MFTYVSPSDCTLPHDINEAILSDFKILFSRTSSDSKIVLHSSIFTCMTIFIVKIIIQSLVNKLQGYMSLGLTLILRSFRKEVLVDSVNLLIGETKTFFSRAFGQFVFTIFVKNKNQLSTFFYVTVHSNLLS